MADGNAPPIQPVEVTGDRVARKALEYVDEGTLSQGNTMLSGFAPAAYEFLLTFGWPILIVVIIYFTVGPEIKDAWTKWRYQRPQAEVIQTTENMQSARAKQIAKWEADAIAAKKDPTRKAGQNSKLRTTDRTFRRQQKGTRRVDEDADWMGLKRPKGGFNPMHRGRGNQGGGGGSGRFGPANRYAGRGKKGG